MLEFIEIYNPIAYEKLERLNIFIDKSVKIEDGVKIYFNNAIKGDSHIAKDAIIFSGNTIVNSSVGYFSQIKNSYIIDSTIESGCKIGPFAHIRENSQIGKNSRIGNYVEIKKSILGYGTKVAHLTYIGDAEIGNECNIGCGVVFCNYDGKNKHTTIVGDRVFIGSNVNLVAPITIADESFIACGSTITEDVNAGELAIARAKQTNKNNFKNPYIEGLDNKKLQ